MELEQKINIVMKIHPAPISLYGTKLQTESLVMTHKNSVAFRLATVFGFSYRMRTDLLVVILLRQQ